RETRKIIRMKAGHLITETRHGFICANAGVDASNVAKGKDTLTLLPLNPDASADRIGKTIRKLTGKTIPVIITDAFGRTWRMGQRTRRQSERELTMEPVKPPRPVHVRDIQNFARLALGLTEGSHMIWSFKHKSSNILAFFTAYMYWDGDIPILAYTEVDFDRTKPFLAYKSDSPKGEEWQFCDEADDTR